MTVLPTTKLIAEDNVVVLRTDNDRDLAQVRTPEVQAVVYEPKVQPDWLLRVSAAVDRESLKIPRTILHNSTLREIDDRLEAMLAHDALDDDARTALKCDILGLVESEHQLTGASRFMFRVFTGTPSRHCGFHVDTVPPNVSPWGLLRVYNGAGTGYVDPQNVTSTVDFYRYLGSRERLIRQATEAQRDGCTQVYTDLLRAVVRLDQERSFLKDPDRVATAPAGSIVAFKHLDVRLHWSNHAKTLAWIHCSPMEGGARLVVNVTAGVSVRRQFVPPARGVIAR